MARMKDAMLCEIELLARMAGCNTEAIIVSRMKDAMPCEIELLARMAGYDPEELLKIYYEVMEDCQEDGVPFDAASFVRITLERDW